MNDFTPATPKQIEYLNSLIGQRELPEEDALKINKAIATGSIGRKGASTWIDYLLTLAKKPKTYIDPPLGMHKVGELITKVYQTRAGHAVAKKLIETDKGWEFSYAGKAGLRGLSESTVMDAAEAAKFGKTFGICVRCAAHLTDERSIFVGYGPICADHQGWIYPTTTEASRGLAESPLSDASVELLSFDF